MSALAAVNLIDAQEHLGEGRRDLAHLCLDAAEGELAQALLTVHLVRVMACAGDLPEP